MISIDDFKKVEMRAGKIISAENVAGSEKLLKLNVDFGEMGPRQVLSGIAKYIKPEELIGVNCAFVTNLEPRQLMGLESQAMIMAISTEATETNPESNFSLLKISENIPLGSIVK
jgi:methionyl-tRNA synthetase